MSDRVVSHGVTSFVIPTDADLPIPWQCKPGDIAVSRSTGNAWILDNTPGTGNYWRQLATGGGGGGGPGSPLLYLVGETTATPGDDTPMGLLPNVFPTVEDARIQSQADFASLGTDYNADILLFPGSYPGFRLVPGMQVSSLVDGGYQQLLVPPAPHTDVPAVTITGTVQLLAADGWVSGSVTPSASLKGVRIDAGAASGIQIGAGVSGGLVQIAAVQIVSSTVAIDEGAGAADLSIMCDNTHVEAFGAVAFSGVGCRLQGFNGSRFTGTMTTSAVEGMAFDDCILLGARIVATGPVPGGGNASARLYRTTMIDFGSGLSLVELNSAAVLFVGPGCDVQNATPDTVDGTGGTVLLAAGSWPGFVGAPRTILFVGASNGRSLLGPGAGAPDVDANGYIAPVGAGPFTYTIPEGTGIELIPIDCSGADPGAEVVVVLPDARRAMAWSVLRAKRLDDKAVSVILRTASPNEFDHTSPATTEVDLGPGGAREFVASREPGVGGVGRWLVT